MIKLLLISNDELLQNFCTGLNRGDTYIVCVPYFIERINESLMFQPSLVLLDFELIKSGNNQIYEDLFTLCDGTPIITLVKETSSVLATKVLRSSCESMINVPCCAEYFYSCISILLEKQSTDILEPEENEILSSIIGVSEEIRAFKKRIIAIAQNELSVLILGETGTGKSFVARIIHRLSARRERNFVEENIAAIQESLAEGELFGTKQGAYTGAISRIGLFEHAHKGTLFLDEIACAKSDIQAKLLQVLETGDFRPVGSVENKTTDVRLICATNASIDSLKNRDLFRDDLYYRISAVQLHIPPLRKRKEDICLLAQHFLDAISKKMGRKKELSAGAIVKLEAHSWPGNIRELERCVECAYCMTLSDVIVGDDIAFIS